MASNNLIETRLCEEVDFWRHLIEEREGRRELVIPKMREALANAERKSEHCLARMSRFSDEGNEATTDHRLH